MERRSQRIQLVVCLPTCYVLVVVTCLVSCLLARGLYPRIDVANLAIPDSLNANENEISGE